MTVSQAGTGVRSDQAFPAAPVYPTAPVDPVAKVEAEALGFYHCAQASDWDLNLLRGEVYSQGGHRAYSSTHWAVLPASQPASVGGA